MKALLTTLGIVIGIASVITMMGMDQDDIVLAPWTAELQMQLCQI